MAVDSDLFSGLSQGLVTGLVNDIGVMQTSHQQVTNQLGDSQSGPQGSDQPAAIGGEQPVHLITGAQSVSPIIPPAALAQMDNINGYSPVPSALAKSPEDEALWLAVKQSLFAKNPNNRLLDVWFSPTSFLGAEQTATGRRFILGVQNNVYKYWIEQNFFDQICAEFNLHYRAPFQIVLECSYVTNPPPDSLSVRNLEEALVAQDRSVEKSVEKPGYSSEQGSPSARPTYDERKDFLKPEFCFNTFVVGAYNEFAHAACYRIAENPGGANGYNPLFICGPTGMGKTHLLNAVGNHIRQIRPELQICYVSAERFLTDFRRSVQSVKRADMDAFKQRYREKPDVLLMDDIYVLGHGEMAQEEFFNTLNHLFLRGKQVVVASDRMPRDIDGLQDRIRTRLEGGLIADVKMPDLDTRIAILRYKAERLRFRLSDEVVSYIARISKRSIRELEGNLNVAKVWSDFYGRELTLEVAKQIMSIRDQSTNLTIEDVQRLVSEHYRVNVKDLKSPSRARPYVTARQLAMYLIHKNLGKSLVEIGRAFGNRDHTTVLNALRRIEDQLGTDPEIKRDLGELQTRIHNLTGV